MTTQLPSDAGPKLTAHTEHRGINRRANNMGPEHLLFFQKPPSR